jgi:hypothetical protein
MTHTTHVEDPQLIEISCGGTKLSEMTHHYSLAAGYSCPGAKECLSKAHRKTGKIKDGKDTKFRCYAASMEATYPSRRAKVWRNLELLKSTEDKTKLIQDSVDHYAPSCRVLRPHVAGDYFSQEYFNSMMRFAEQNPSILVYFYTKSLHFWAAYLDREGDLPHNVVANASWGGAYDHLIEEYSMKSVMVQYHPEPSIDEWTDHDDNLAMIHPVNWRGPRLAGGAPVFYQMIHGTQPKGSEASKALSGLRKSGWTGYNKKTKSKTINIKTKRTYEEQLSW